jgi:O-acetyl-ADP-ribose deacetylase (regulator of RNase III)
MVQDHSEKTNSRTYKYGKSLLTIEFGDITTSKSQVIVSSDDAYISMGGGVSASILRAGGQEIIIDASKKVPAMIGDVVVTTAGRLSASYIFHAITIGAEYGAADPRVVLQKALPKCFDLLVVLGLNSIAFPAIGAGAAGFDYETVAVEMAKAMAPRLIGSSTPIVATLYLYDRFGQMDRMDYIQFFEEFRARIPELSTQEIPKQDTKAKPVAEVQKPTQPIAQRHDVTLRIGRLTEERAQLEERLARLMDGSQGKEEDAIRARLAAVQDERLQLLKELQYTPDKKVLVFISYAHEDSLLVKELLKHLSTLKRRGIIEEWYDRDIPAGSEWKDEIDDRLNSAKIVLLIVSPDFIDSDYVNNVELKRALERHESGDARVIPVILRSCMWSETPFGKLQALPPGTKPLKEWGDPDDFFRKVAEGIRDAVESLAGSSRSTGA